MKLDNTSDTMAEERRRGIYDLVPVSGRASDTVRRVYGPLKPEPEDGPRIPAPKGGGMYKRNGNYSGD